jgi:hypothetical protein
LTLEHYLRLQLLWNISAPEARQSAAFQTATALNALAEGDAQMRARIG